jgi:hypothetical protein
MKRVAHPGKGKLREKNVDPGVVADENLKIPFLLSGHPRSPEFQNSLGVPAEKGQSLPIGRLVLRASPRTQVRRQIPQFLIVDQAADISIAETFSRRLQGHWPN